jgi:hypothetical protein
MTNTRDLDSPHNKYNKKFGLGKRDLKVFLDQELFDKQGVANYNANVIDLVRNSKQGQFGNYKQKNMDIKLDIDKTDDR